MEQITLTFITEEVTIAGKVYKINGLTQRDIDTEAERIRQEIAKRAYLKLLIENYPFLIPRY